MHFTPIRPLLNPQFEGYKLDFSQSPQLVHVPLKHRPTQSRAGTRALGFQEVASRIRHNHLAVGESIDSAVYITDDGSVVLVCANNEVHQDEDGVTLYVVFRLPQPTTIAHVQAEYPAAAYITRDMWLVSDGRGHAYLLHMEREPESDGVTAKLLAAWQLRTDDVLTPFQLHTVGLVESGLALAILSSSSHNTDSSSTTKSQKTFDIRAVRVPLPDPLLEAVVDTALLTFDIVWRRHGTHIPLFVKYVREHNAILLMGGSSYRDVTSTPPNLYEPTPDELAPIPRIGESLDTPAPPLYSWTQTEDTVTVAFAIPGTTTKASIDVIFQARTFSLHAGTPPLPRPSYTAAPLWDAIHPASSLWTWERGDSNQAGLLTLHLDKAHPGTRWSHVFAQGFDVEVPETLDPSELAGIRDSLDKYTASLQDNASGLGHGLPSLATGERDNEVDSDVGNSVMLTWVDIDGGASQPADDTPAVLLSQPLPGATGSLTLVIKNDIDGPLYTLNDAREWAHIATYPALAFVLASKRDMRFTFHIKSTVALAFESGARDGGANVYLYYGSTPGEKWAKQSVFQLRAGVGALLGVGAVTSKAGHTMLLCLSERELTVCRGLS